MNAIGIDIGGTAIKLAAADGAGKVLWTARGAPHARPSVDELAAAIRAALGAHAAEKQAFQKTPVGLCVPGVLDERREVVLRSVNVPALDGVRLEDLVEAALGARPAVVRVATDAHATAFDLFVTRRPAGRMFVLAIGTGAGAAVLDDGRPLHVDGDSPGHFGQIDVSLEGERVIGPDGGAGGLEGYLSAGALAARFGPDLTEWVTRVRAHDPPMRALVRAVRIAHALYRPQHVFLAGGIGIRLAPLCADLYAAISRDLTGIARPGWTLSTGDSDFHAAQGAARRAMTEP